MSFSKDGSKLRQSAMETVAISASDIRGGATAATDFIGFLNGDRGGFLRFILSDFVVPVTDWAETDLIWASTAASLAFLTLRSLASDPFLAIEVDGELASTTALLPISFIMIFVLL